MKHAFEKVGINKEDMTFHMHVLKYFESGGEYERGIAIYNQAAEKLGKKGQSQGVQHDQCVLASLPRPMPEGQSSDVRQDHLALADGLPMPSEGQLRGVHRDQNMLADARPQTLSEDHDADVQQDPVPDVSTEHPLPGGHQPPAQQGLVRSANGQPKASGEASVPLPHRATQPMPPAREPNEAFRRALMDDRMRNAAIWLELNKTSDGRAWAKVAPYEFAGMERDARFVRHVKFVFGEFNQKQMNTPLGKLFTADMQRKLAARVQLMEARHA